MTHEEAHTKAVLHAAHALDHDKTYKDVASDLAALSLHATKLAVSAYLAAMAREGFVMERDWRPISEAPMDGTSVLLFWPYWGADPVVGYRKHDKWVTPINLLDDGGEPGPTHFKPLTEPKS